MSNLLFSSKAYLKYLASSKKGTLAHSPFVFDLANSVFYPKEHKDAVGQKINISAFKKKLNSDKSGISKTDFGTGASKEIRISALAKSSSVRSKYGRLLTRLVQFQNPNSILELGTCLGVSSLYMYNGLSGGSLTSVEGCTETFNARAQLFTELGINVSNIKFVNDQFDRFLEDQKHVCDFVFIDGNHTYLATKKYFKLFWENLPENGVIILDDIHWSEQMELSWTEIINETDCLITIDLFQFGLCFKKSKQAKEHFVVRY